MSAQTPLGDLLDQVYSELAVTRPSEYIYKNNLVSKIVFGRHRPSTAAATIELPVGASVADVLIVNGTSTIYEIKTDLDSFSRLSTQLADYCRLAEKVYLVTSVRRVGQALRQAPLHVGVLGIDGRGSIKTLREAQGGLERLEPDYLHGALRGPERRRVLAKAGFRPLDMSPIDIKLAFRSLRIEDLRSLTVGILRSRFSSPAAMVTLPHFPSALRALAYGTPLSMAAQHRLTTRLSRLPDQIPIPA